MVTQVILCQHCGSTRIVRNGCAPNGKQRYRCRDCGRQSRHHTTKPGYSELEREQILAAYQERSSLRGLQRTFGVAPATVTKWLKKSPVAAAVGGHGDGTAPGSDVEADLGVG